MSKLEDAEKIIEMLQPNNGGKSAQIYARQERCEVVLETPYDNIGRIHDEIIELYDFRYADRVNGQIENLDGEYEVKVA